MRLKHKKEIEAMKEIHDAKYTAMEKVEERLKEDLKEFRNRENERV